MTWKQARKQIEVSSLGAKQTLKIGSPNQPKIDKILFWTSSRPSCCSHGPPRAPDVPEWSRQNSKMSLQNGNREELKGAGGRGRSPQEKTMEKNLESITYLSNWSARKLHDAQASWEVIWLRNIDLEHIRELIGPLGVLENILKLCKHPLVKWSQWVGNLFWRTHMQHGDCNLPPRQAHRERSQVSVAKRIIGGPS